MYDDTRTIEASDLQGLIHIHAYEVGEERKRRKKIYGRNELKRETKNVLTLARNKDANQPATTRSLVSFHTPHEDTLHPWLSNMSPLKSLSDCVNALADLNHPWAHMSEGHLLTLRLKSGPLVSVHDSSYGPRRDFGHMRTLQAQVRALTVC